MLLRDLYYVVLCTYRELWYDCLMGVRKCFTDNSFKSASLNTMSFYKQKVAVEYVFVNRLCQTEGIDLKDVGLFWATVAIICGHKMWGRNAVNLTLEEIIDMEYRVLILFPVRNRTPIKIFCQFFESKQWILFWPAQHLLSIFMIIVP